MTPDEMKAGNAALSGLLAAADRIESAAWCLVDAGLYRTSEAADGVASSLRTLAQQLEDGLASQ